MENLLGQHLDVQYRLVVAKAGSAKDYELEEADRQDSRAANSTVFVMLA